MAIKGVDVAAGVVDPDYRGELKVIMVNGGPKTHVVTQGSRIAQIILERIVTNAEVEIANSLPTTTRGTNGFGHTDAYTYLSYDDWDEKRASHNYGNAGQNYGIAVPGGSGATFPTSSPSPQ